MTISKTCCMYGKIRKYSGKSGKAKIICFRKRIFEKRVKLYLSVNLKIGPSGPKNRLNWGWPRNNSAAEKNVLCFVE